MTLELIYKENKDKESKDTNSDFVLYVKKRLNYTLIRLCYYGL